MQVKTFEADLHRLICQLTLKLDTDALLFACFLRAAKYLRIMMVGCSRKPGQISHLSFPPSASPSIFNTPFPPLIPTKTLCKKPWLEVTRGKSQNCALYTLFQEHVCTRITDEGLRAWCILNLFWDLCFILSVSPFQRLMRGFIKNTWARNEEENPFFFFWDNVMEGKHIAPPQVGS